MRQEGRTNTETETDTDTQNIEHRIQHRKINLVSSSHKQLIRFIKAKPKNKVDLFYFRLKSKSSNIGEKKLFLAIWKLKKNNNQTNQISNQSIDSQSIFEKKKKNLHWNVNSIPIGIEFNPFIDWSIHFLFGLIKEVICQVTIIQFNNNKVCSMVN